MSPGPTPEQEPGPHGGYQYGYGTPGPPPAPGVPPYPQYPGDGGPQGPYPSRGTNGLAIASLVCSIGAFVFCVTAPIGLILGIVALSQIRRTHEEGRGLAIAGAWIGGILTAIMVAGLVFLAGLTVFSSVQWSDGPDCTDSEGYSVSCPE